MKPISELQAVLFSLLEQPDWIFTIDRSNENAVKTLHQGTNCSLLFPSGQMPLDWDRTLQELKALSSDTGTISTDLTLYTVSSEIYLGEYKTKPYPLAGIPGNNFFLKFSLMENGIIAGALYLNVIPEEIEEYIN